MISIDATPLLQTSNSKILVFERHDYLYHSLKRNREERYGGAAILGGQWGVGGSLLSSLVLPGPTDSRSAAGCASSTPKQGPSNDIILQWRSQVALNPISISKQYGPGLS
ncbi:hypothetical protein BT96DRAFT_998500 [Gymnopus androsaceus JB14]|uniref:Uncharacterized protein n=1 Tax=Gymnopus androsaceus JB14 TaxID=1447944 RepID=A0A6A4H8D7_9AGAR|nr:hypothetical protein BT96DRAFT_998500 [Gymnopus androsaceus JB14]